MNEKVVCTAREDEQPPNLLTLVTFNEFGRSVKNVLVAATTLQRDGSRMC